MNAIYLSTEQAAAELGISAIQVRYLCRKGLLDHHRPDRRTILVLRSGIESARNRPGVGRPKKAEKTG